MTLPQKRHRPAKRSPRRHCQPLRRQRPEPEDDAQRLQRAAVAATEHVQRQHGGNLERNRLRDGLELTLANAVIANLDGTANVRSDERCHIVTGDSCTCEDHTHRHITCKHIIAVAIYARTAALLNGSSDAPANAPPENAPRSAAWDVHEAPVSCNLKLRVGQIELMYTMRDVNDGALQTRLKDVLPRIQAMQDDACERKAERPADRAETPAQPEAIQRYVEQALQQALAANGAPQARSATNGDTPNCPEHGPMRASDKQPGGFLLPKEAAKRQVVPVPLHPQDV